MQLLFHFLLFFLFSLRSYLFPSYIYSFSFRFWGDFATLLFGQCIVKPFNIIGKINILVWTMDCLI